MRAAAVLSLMFPILLAACGGSTETAAPGATPTPADTRPIIEGTIIAEQPQSLSPGATLTVRLLDITRVDSEPMAVTTETFPLTAIPAQFRLRYDPQDVNAIRTYAVDASVMDQGVVRFISNGRIGVLTHGKPDNVTLMMSQAMAAAAPKDPVAEMKQELEAFEQILGGLKRITGERVNEAEEIAIGWDAFLDDGGVRLVREMISYPDGSRVNARFGFKDGDPWYMVRESNGTTVRLGWNAEGDLVFAERNGKPAEFSEGDLGDYRRQANDARSLARAQAGGGR